MDETLEISREKLFEILSKAFSDLCDEAMSLLKTDNKTEFIDRIEKIIDNLNHDILEKSKREKPVVEEPETKIELDWS
jgi:hypothetical protein